MTANRISQLKEIISLEEKRAELQAKVDAIDEQIAAIQNGLYNVKGKPAVASKGKSATTGARKGRGALREEILEALAAAGPKGAAVLELASLLNTKPANIHSWFSTNLKKTKGLKKIGEARYALTGALPAAPAPSPEKPAKPAKSTTGRKASAKAGRKAAGAKGEKEPKAAKAPKAAKSAKAANSPASGAKAPKAKATKAAAAKRAASAESKAAAKSARKAASKADGKTPAKRGELKARIIDTLKAAGPAGVSVTELSEKLGVKYRNLYIWFLTTGKRIPGLEKVGSAQYALK